jgi:deoxycytidylate deaminase
LKKTQKKNIKLDNFPRKLNILVIRINANGDFVNSMPCHMCVKLMKYLCINKVFYTNEYGKIISQKVKVFKGCHITKCFKCLNVINGNSKTD